MSEMNNQVQNNPAHQHMVALNPAPGEIQLFIIKAENIPQGRIKHPVYLAITADGRKKFKSPLFKVEGGTATFNKIISGIHPLQSQQLTLSLMKKRILHKNKAIAQFFLPVQVISTHGLTEITLPLQDNGFKSPSITLRAAFMLLSAPEAMTRVTSQPNLESSAVVNAMVGSVGTSAQTSSIMPATFSSAIAAQEAVDSGDILLSAMSHASGHLVAGIEQTNALTDNLQSAYNEWGSLLGKVLENIKPFIQAIDQVSEIHPYIKIAWTVFSVIPKAILHQETLDASIAQLQHSIAKTLEFCFVADLKSRLSKDKEQKKILSALFKLITQCGHFISNYAMDQLFFKRLVKNTFKDLDTRIQEFQFGLVQLKESFLNYSIIEIQSQSYILLDGIREIQEKIDKLDIHTTLNRLFYPPNARHYSFKGFLPGTRQAVLEDIHTWFWNPSSPQMLLLAGQAGRGKSAIAYEVASKYKEIGLLCSSFMFRRGDTEGREAYRLFHTIAKDLAHLSPSYALALCSAMQATPDWEGTHDYNTLFQLLIKEPLAKVEIAGPLLIVIDGLDECVDEDPIHSLSAFLGQNMCLPKGFLVLITTRLENNIIKCFTRCAFMELERANDEDLTLYLSHQLKTMQLNPDIIPKLISKAEGLFQWAFVASNLILHNQRANPGQVIQKLLHPSTHPLAGLYFQALNNLNLTQYELKNFHMVLGIIVSVAAPISVSMLKNFLQTMNPTIIDNILQSMGALLSNVHTCDAPVFPLHTSFRDFLLEPAQSREYSLGPDLQFYHTLLANLCFAHMMKGLKFNICKIKSSFTQNAHVTDKKVNKCISGELRYVCQYWLYHLAELDNLEILHSTFFEWAKTKILEWIEVLSLAGSMNIILGDLDKLIKRILAKNSVIGEQELYNWIIELQNFLRSFLPILSSSVPHIYISCMLWCPKDSLIGKQYRTNSPNIVQFAKGGVDIWPIHMIKRKEKFYGIHSLAFSPDGQRVVSGSADKTVRIWNTFTGTQIGQPLKGHSGIVLSVAISPNGQTIVSGSSDQTVRIWNPLTGAQIGQPLRGHSNWVYSVAISPDGQRIASGSDDNTVRIWDISTGAQVGQPFDGHSSYVNSVAFSLDGQRIVSGSSDQTVRVWDAFTGAQIGQPFKGHSSYVNCVAFSPDGQRVVSGSFDDTIRMWDASTALEGSQSVKGDASNNFTELPTDIDQSELVLPVIDPSTRFNQSVLLPSSMIDYNGWIRCYKTQNHLLWVPISYASCTSYYPCIWSTLPIHLDFSSALFGDSWEYCRISMPSY